jgi:hypothetical protein
MPCSPSKGHVFVMRGIVALVIVAMSFTLSGCACPPHQAGAPKPVRSKCALAQSQPRAPKFTKASVAKSLTKASRPVSKRSKKFKTHVSKPARPQIEPPASADMGPPLPPRRPEPAHIKSPAADAESPPPLPPRKPEETSTSAPDSREHAVEPAGNFMAAKEKAMREGVHSLTSEDIRGLSQEQIKELRGY